MAALPAAVIGFAGLTDGIGPKGWRGFAEVFGWAVACLLTAIIAAFLLARASRAGTLAYMLSLATVAGMGALGYRLLEWLGLDAPMSAKALFTSSLQVLGAFGAAICVILVANVFWERVTT
ncbi:hypothetical protein DC429_02420 [Arthrobacter sp. TPD3018]|uniref:hypothetical protein n=1 Tax=Bacteria TaxID=2 RepID=UPI000D50FBCA|nr:MULTISPECIES: hypothetical protein [Bacteria]PVE59283.1 hypothetical protein DC425_02420 [Sphingomonas sp. TPD3009]PVE60804.1 hypothetical protein DC429_02420 [Arthrobacter sp. TPD3018]PVE87482.1 hypothetical protein DC431_02415 [Sphingomonas melonis]